MTTSSQIITHTDSAGLRFRVELPPNCTDPTVGHIIGPPAFNASLLDLDVDAILRRLHNELEVRGIITERDTLKPGGAQAITDAIRAATTPIVSVSKVIATYQDREEGT